MLKDQFQIIHFDQIESTNSYAIELVSNSSPNEGTVISADFQTHGRGQIGRFWHSEPSLNLLFTIILYPTFLKVQNQFVLSQSICLGIVKALSKLGINAMVKWPNDIYVGDCKLAGILIQNQILGKSLRSSVVGIGLNVNQHSFPAEIPNPISIYNIVKIPIIRREILSEIWSQIRIYYNKAALGQLDSIRLEYHENMYKKNQLQWFETNERFEGRVKGVDASGFLVVEQNQVELSFDFREIKWLVNPK
jgi:BirA family biotin operon repressor/biotin-[acetyl-CoA-carboxylase] ligase